MHISAPACPLAHADCMGEIMQSWIFQGNPKIYDISRAVRSLKEDTWLVQQHGKDIRAGDRVYFWESGPNGGIVAIGQVLDEVCDRNTADESLPFVRDSRKLGGVQPRVRVRIERVVEPKLKRSVIKGNPGLGGLSILKFAMGTNFEVTPEQAKIICELIPW